MVILQLKNGNQQILKGTRGVVGYHIRLTRERSPVQTRPNAFF